MQPVRYVVNITQTIIPDKSHAAILQNSATKDLNESGFFFSHFEKNGGDVGAASLIFLLVPPGPPRMMKPN